MEERANLGRRRAANDEFTAGPEAAWGANFCGATETGLMSIADADADLRKNNPIYRQVCKTLDECKTLKSEIGHNPEWERRWDRN